MSESPGLMRYLSVAGVGPTDGVGATVAKITVTSGVTAEGVRVRAAVGVVAAPLKPKRAGPPSNTNATIPITTMSNTMPAITIQGGSESFAVSPRCAGTRCTIRS